MIPERYPGYEKFVTLGAVNFTCVAGDKAANLAKIEANMREAAAQGVNILAFPEEALTGCAPCRDGADQNEQLISATVSFEKLHRWKSIFPWCDWRAGRLSKTSELIAHEFKKLTHGS